LIFAVSDVESSFATNIVFSGKVLKSIFLVLVSFSKSLFFISRISSARSDKYLSSIALNIFATVLNPFSVAYTLLYFSSLINLKVSFVNVGSSNIKLYAFIISCSVPVKFSDISSISFFKFSRANLKFLSSFSTS